MIRVVIDANQGDHLGQFHPAVIDIEFSLEGKDKVFKNHLTSGTSVHFVPPSASFLHV